MAEFTYADAVRRYADMIERYADLLESFDWDDPDPGEEEEDDEPDLTTAVPTVCQGPWEATG